MERQTEVEKTYKHPVLFLRKSRAGKTLYAFNREEEGKSVLGGGIGSILIDVSEIERLIVGTTEWIKVSILPVEE